MYEDKIRTVQPTEVEQKEIALKSADLYDKFLILDTDQILDRYPEVYIRGVAIMAGMIHVDDFHPKKIDGVFIEEVKRAINSKKLNRLTRQLTERKTAYFA